MNTVVLASSSPRRIELLSQYKIDFVSMKAEIEEKILPGESPREVAMALAFEKANQIADKLKPGKIVIGADTIVACQDRILGKPRDKNEGIEILKFLSGKEHCVITGVAIVVSGSNKKIIDFEETRVQFRKLTNRKIEKYIETKEYVDKAGSYGIQGIGGILIESINGCYFNVVGLPLYKLDILLEKYFDINLL